MAKSSNDLFNEMMGVLDQYQAYNPGNKNDIYSDLSARMDNFKPQYEELGSMEKTAYAAPATLMKGYYDNYTGQGKQGPSAINMLNSIMNTVGGYYGSMNTMRGLLDQKKAQLSDIANTVYSQNQANRGAVMDRYNMLMPMYNSRVQQEQEAQRLAWQKQEAAAQRLAAERAMQLQQQMAQRQIDQQNKAQRLNQFAQAISGLNTRKTASQRMSDVGGVLKQFQDIYPGQDMATVYRMAGFSDKNNPYLMAQNRGQNFDPYAHYTNYMSIYTPTPTPLAPAPSGVSVGNMNFPGNIRSPLGISGY